ncbi:MAG: cytochrome b [Pseudohongiellaceae bacterium]
MSQQKRSDPHESVGEFSVIQRLGHWSIAMAIFYLFVSSWWMLSLPLPSESSTFRVLPFQLHKNVGITLFIVTTWMFISLQLRLKGRRAIKGRSTLSRIGHVMIYLLIGLCCISGYLSSSFSGWGTELWWIIELPLWAEENDELNQLFSDFHLWICWLLLLFVAIHIGAALFHALKNDRAIERIIGSQ